MLDNNLIIELDFSCCVVCYYCVYGNEGCLFFNLENECVRCEWCNREIFFRIGVKINRKGNKVK